MQRRAVSEKGATEVALSGMPQHDEKQVAGVGCAGGQQQHWALWKADGKTHAGASRPDYQCSTHTGTGGEIGPQH